MLHFIIGDIHGCIDELLSLEEEVQRVAAKMNLPSLIISTGDLVDRGPDSKGVVQHFLRGEQAGTHLAVMGNHESNFLGYLKAEHSAWFKKNKLKVPKYLYSSSELYRQSRWSKGFTKDEYPILVKGFWLGQGGVETLQSYGVNTQQPNYSKLPPEHVKFLCRLPLFYESKKFIVTHALPKKKDFRTIKNYCSGKSSLSLDIKNACNDIYWNRDWSGVKKIGNKVLVSGHTPFKRPKRTKNSNVIQVDTHCYNGGRLTAYCPELDKLFSVPAKKRYYSN